MNARCELSLTRAALAPAAAPMRHALDAFLRALDVCEEARIDIVTAVGEALANSIEHAYGTGPVGEIALHASLEAAPRQLAVAVVDNGVFVERELRANRGFGLRIVRSVARSMTLDTQEGTALRMVFDAPAV